MDDTSLTEHISLALSKRHLKAVDEWRRAQPNIPTRAKAFRQIIEAMLAMSEDNDDTAALKSCVNA